MSDASASIAQEFLKFYYDTFEGDRQNLAPLYRPESKLTYEDKTFGGVEQIVTKIAEMPQMKRELVSLISHYAGNEGAIMIMMHGHLLASDTHRMNFIHVFNLQRDAGGNYFVGNEMFQLVYNA